MIVSGMRHLRVTLGKSFRNSQNYFVQKRGWVRALYDDWLGCEYLSNKEVQFLFEKEFRWASSKRDKCENGVVGMISFIQQEEQMYGHGKQRKFINIKPPKIDEYYKRNTSIMKVTKELHRMMTKYLHSIKCRGVVE